MHVLTILHFITISSMVVGQFTSHCQEETIKTLPQHVLCTIVLYTIRTYSDFMQQGQSRNCISDRPTLASLHDRICRHVPLDAILIHLYIISKSYCPKQILPNVIGDQFSYHISKFPLRQLSMDSQGQFIQCYDKATLKLQ